MGTQEARPGSAGVREGGTAGGGGRRRPGAASSPEKHRPPADPPSRLSAPPPGPRRGIATERGRYPLSSVRRCSTLSAGRGLGTVALLQGKA
ncbi:PREDICTED: protein PRRC2A-like [Rhinopithecus bieti]|uniref:protein PRRC2A-like n=1 Tax=Rhinopithecus bieti TaxID=61621 RepID=UPI00083BB4A3|nr:PREDICTED: protein PRRC2A-like [Rhinopithecus bieti]